MSCGVGRIQTCISRQWASVLSVEAYDPDRQFLWPTMPLQDIDRTPIGLAGRNYEQISIVYSEWQNHCRFRSYSPLDSWGQLLLSPPGSRCLVTPPASSGCWICRKSVASYYLAAIMSRNSAVFPEADLHRRLALAGGSAH